MRCLNEEPYVFEKVHNSAICQLKESVLSDPCNYEISKQNREDVSDIFHDSLRKAKNRADYVKAILDYATASGAASNSPTARLHCQTISHNLECKKDGKCGCVYKEPYMKYVSDAKQPYCVGESGAICNIVLRTTVAAFDELVTCAEGLKCQDAVPGLHCPDFYREDCVFDYPYEGENEDMQNKSSQIIFWNIRACGGRWKDKPELVLSHGIRQGLAFQDFLMWLKIVGVDIIWNIVHPGMT
ncbi:unnamed protein product [Allacma fusca]|nr:unnamed protein product [Allacma fusca]